MSNLLNLRFKTKEEAKLHWDNAYNSNISSFLCYCYENDVFYVCYKIPKIAYIKYTISRYLAEVICGKDPIAYLIKELSSEHPSSRFMFQNLVVRKLGLEYFKGHAEEYRDLQ